jgi:hypothetical protein
VEQLARMMLESLRQAMASRSESRSGLQTRVERSSAAMEPATG